MKMDQGCVLRRRRSIRWPKPRIDSVHYFMPRPLPFSLSVSVSLGSFVFELVWMEIQSFWRSANWFYRWAGCLYRERCLSVAGVPVQGPCVREPLACK